MMMIMARALRILQSLDVPTEPFILEMTVSSTNN